MPALPRILALSLLAFGTACTPEPEIRYLAVPAEPGSQSPNLAAGAAGEIVLSWLEPGGAGHALRYSMLRGDLWSDPRTVTHGDDWFVNWADFPSVVPVSDTLWGAHWLVSQPAGGYAYDVQVALSTDGGNSWSEPVMPHRDGTPTEHGFVSLYPHDGGIGAVWLDGRNMANEESGRVEDTGMTLRSAVLGPDLTVRDEQQVDGLICDCCPTDIAITVSGAVAVYRDRTADEIRDIFVSRFADGSWAPGNPVARDDWQMPACPVNGPAVDALGSAVIVAWFTAANGTPRVRLAWSSDAGATFSAPVEIAQAGVYGRVGVALVPDGDAIVSWLAQTENEYAALYAVRVGLGGRVGEPVDVSAREQVPALSMPQIAIAGGELVAAWTVIHDGHTRIRSARVPLDLL